ncbi:MAG TPA: tRNA lysidine(34) synthetase TilS [Opitutaceae bacterium]|nr:tRNA lysidine(34) synthetase TilS [Opitutaceae bacterium]
MKTPGASGWRAAAEALGGLVERSSLHPTGTRWADARPARENWGVALSGGADSVALLLFLWVHWPDRRARLTAYHFNHRLRGKASDGDERFCKALCRALGIAFVSGKWTAAKRSRTEAAARAARFEFLEREMKRRRSKVLWLGHQQDDIAETMLMRLSRGSGTAGLAAPRPVHGFAGSGKASGSFHVRPLLTLKKADIAKALRKAGATWREDESNAKDVHFRNRVRRSVLPAWVKASQRDALAGAALSRQLLEEDNDALETWLASLDPFGVDGSLDLVRLKGRPRAVVRRALYQWLQGVGGAGDFSRQAFTILLHSVEVGSPVRHSLGSHGFAVIRSGRLRFETARKPRSLH